MKDTVTPSPAAGVEFPAAVAGMTQVADAAFFGTVGQLDVCPYPTGRHDKVTGYVSEWRMRDGSVVAKSFGGTHACPSIYFVTTRFFEANQSALAAIRSGGGLV